jgi:hypothetical protein
MANQANISKVPNGNFQGGLMTYQTNILKILDGLTLLFGIGSVNFK